jgi:hypothetical protein
MGKIKDLHVVLHNEGWVIRKEGGVRAISVHRTQREAVEAAREIARSQNGELVIHGRNGRVRSRNSYATDSLPPRDRVVLFPLSAPSVSRRAIREAIKAVMESSKNGPRSSPSLTQKVSTKRT